MKICIVGALPSSLMNFRGHLIREFVRNGYQVIALASGASECEEQSVTSLGVKYIDYPIQRNGLNPFFDLRTLVNLAAIFRRERPDVILAYTIKPVIWGGLAARISPGSRFYGLITGLGYTHEKGGLGQNLLRLMVKWLYRFSLSKAAKVIFQNSDNLNFFVKNRIVKVGATARINGSGVDLAHFVRSRPPENSFTFLTIARLLGAKGLREYAQAARLVKSCYKDVIFRVVGPEDPSPDGISITEIEQWHEDGYIEYCGPAEDVRPFLDDCHVFVLASYHEGMPRSVLEAMATGRPILTTDVSGCRDTVVQGRNGFLVPKQNITQLAESMIWFIDNSERLDAMGDYSRTLAVKQFDVHQVNDKLFGIMQLKRDANVQAHI